MDPRGRQSLGGDGGTGSGPDHVVASTAPCLTAARRVCIPGPSASPRPFLRPDWLHPHQKTPQKISGPESDVAGRAGSSRAAAPAWAPEERPLLSPEAWSAHSVFLPQTLGPGPRGRCSVASLRSGSRPVDTKRQCCPPSPAPAAAGPLQAPSCPWHEFSSSA